MKSVRETRVQAAKDSAGLSANHIYRSVIQSLATVGTSGSILDFGAGTGTLSEMLCREDCFHSVTAVDLVGFESAVFKHEKLKWTFADLNEPLPLPDASFDAIVAAEVIEHLENPRFVVRELFRLVAPGGTVIITTPNNEAFRSFLSLAFRGHFIAFVDQCYPAHITALLRRDLERICREVGFENVEFTFTGHGAIPCFTKWTWQKVSFGLLDGVRFSDNLVCIARKPARKQSPPVANQPM